MRLGEVWDSRAVLVLRLKRSHDDRLEGGDSDHLYGRFLLTASRTSSATPVCEAGREVIVGVPRADGACTARYVAPATRMEACCPRLVRIDCWGTSRIKVGTGEPAPGLCGSSSLHSYRRQQVCIGCPSGDELCGRERGTRTLSARKSARKCTSVWRKYGLE
jgi:hypothetical protein